MKMLAVSVLLSTVFAAGAAEYKVMTYNIWASFAYGKETETGIRFLREHPADVLVVEELKYSPEDDCAAWAKSWGYDHIEVLRPEVSVAVCSRYPIEVLEKRTEGMHHGYILCRIDGIYYLATHLSPFKWETRLAEAKIIADTVRPLLERGEKVIILGDMNMSNPDEAKLLDENPHLIETKLGQDAQYPHCQNLNNGRHDFQAAKVLLDLPMTDICQYLSGDRFFGMTYPTLSGVGGERDKQSWFAERIDLILVSRNLVDSCIKAEMLRTPATEKISDHYPVMLTLEKE